MADPEYIVLHHSLTEDGETNDWEAIRKYHTSWRYQGRIITAQEAAALKAQGKKPESPWSDIGYHLGIELQGGKIVLQQGRPIGRPGAHCVEAGMNRRSIGICVVGNFDLAPPSLEKLTFLRSVITGLKIKYAIPPANVIGHRDAGLMAGFDWRKGQFKTCPGKLFPLDTLRGMLTGTI